MNKIKIGVMHTKQLRERMIDIATGRYIPVRTVSGHPFSGRFWPLFCLSGAL